MSRILDGNGHPMPVHTHDAGAPACPAPGPGMRIARELPRRRTMKRRIHAFCWRSGQIDFAPEVPFNANVIATGEEDEIRRMINCTALVARDNKTYLVPGVTEATNEEEAFGAMSRYINRCYRWLAQRTVEDEQAAFKALCRYIERLGQRNRIGFRACGA